MTALTKKDVKFEWTPEANFAFEALKTAFTSAPVLAHFDSERNIIVETDASDYVSAGVLSQRDDLGILHPVAFFSKKHSPAECNYEIYDKELLAIIRCFEEWRPHLESAKDAIQVLCDHKNLEYFMSTKMLNRRQARWSEFLSRFEFKINFRPGKQGGKPDALTRRSGDLPKEGDERLLHQSQTVLKTENLDISAATLSSKLETLFAAANTLFPTLETLFVDAYKSDPFPSSILRMLEDGVQISKDISLGDCSNLNNRLLYRDCHYVPDHDPLRLHLLQTHHDSPATGHPGRAKMFELLARSYYWPGMRKSVERYIRNCHTCKRSKTTHHAPYGVLRPLPVPHRPWTDLAMDFVTGLPESNGFDAIMVIIDRLTKMRHLIPCNTTVNAREVADIFTTNVWRLHGLPDTIVSDRGPQFVSKFWKHLCTCLGIQPHLSTAFHPQTDGQTERANAVMEQYLRSYVCYQQDDWAKLLPLAEFAANNAASEATSISPFFANHGYNPKFNFDLSQPTSNPDTVDAEAVATTMNQVHDFLRSEMRYSQDRYETSTNSSRLPAPRYKVGDMVWLSAKNIRTNRPARKLDWKCLGKFPVLRVVSPYAYKLDLPTTMKIHPVFHVSLLEPASSDPLPGQIEPPPPPVVVEGEDEYAIQEILDYRLRNKEHQYLVQWKGYDQPSWEPARNFLETSSAEDFHRLYPRKPRPAEFT